MSVTININGLTLCHRGSGGVTHNTLPDVCKTPDKGIPIPYQNEAYSRDLVSGTTTVFADGGNMIAFYGSEFCKSVFDEAGSMGGVASGTNKAEADWICHSFDVFFEGKGACRLTDKMFHNHRNAANMGGVLQAHLSGYSGNDATMKAACEVFCTIRQEGIDAKKKVPPDARFDYSKRAKELAEDHPGLKNLAKEKSFRHLTKVGSLADNAAFPAIKNRILGAAMKKAGEQVITRAAKKAFLKFIPVVNVLSTAWDVYDIASTGYEVLKQVEAQLNARTVYEGGVQHRSYDLKPDMTSVGPDGKPNGIYDFKFDRERMTDGNGKQLGKYQDDWQEGQKELYEEAVGKDNVHKVDNERCKCKSK